MTTKNQARLLVVLAMAVMAWQAFVAGQLLKWFVQPMFSQNVTVAAGVAVLVTLIFMFDMTTTYADEAEIKRYRVYLVKWTLIPVLALLFGWIVRVYLLV